MLTLKRNPGFGFYTDDSTIDITYKDEVVTICLINTYVSNGESVALWKIMSTDWGNEKYHPKYIALTNNQPLLINDWLKVFGSRVNEGEAVMHLAADKEAIINRRDRVKHDDN